VVVIGSTQTSWQCSLGNAISSIKAEDLEKSGTGNVFGALQGKVPGAQITQNSGDPAGGLTIRLRGVKSLQGSSDPLYVIDGVGVSNASTNVSQLAPADQVGEAVPGQNRLADLNPQDIESINVINGAAAAAIYGPRASNGVEPSTSPRSPAAPNDVQFNLTPLPGLSIDWIVGVNTYSQLGKNYMPPYPYAAASGLPLGFYPQGFAANATNQVLLFDTDLNVRYNKTFGDLALTATACLNYQFHRSDFTRASGQNQRGAHQNHRRLGTRGRATRLRRG